MAARFDFIFGMTQVPFLGDIPFIGGLFRHTADLTRKTDLIIQVTPHILDRGYSLEKSRLIKESEQKYFPDAVPKEKNLQSEEDNEKK